MESSTGMNSGLDGAQAQSTPVLTPSTDSSVSQSTSNHSTEQHTAPAVKERLFTQSELNDHIGRAKREAVERDRRSREQQQFGSQLPQQEQQQYTQASSNDEAIRKIVAEETQRQRAEYEQQQRQRTEQEQAQAIVAKFWNKISTGKEKYQDYDKVVGDIEFARFPNTVQLLAEHVDNSADLLYELGKDRFKMAQLESLSYMSPKDAILQAQRLANSIKENEAASKVKLPNEPLSQMRPSQSGTSSDGLQSHRDLRMKYRA